MKKQPHTGAPLLGQAGARPVSQPPTPVGWEAASDEDILPMNCYPEYRVSVSEPETANDRLIEAPSREPSSLSRLSGMAQDLEMLFARAKPLHSRRNN